MFDVENTYIPEIKQLTYSVKHALVIKEILITGRKRKLPVEVLLKTAMGRKSRGLTNGAADLLDNAFWHDLDHVFL